MNYSDNSQKNFFHHVSKYPLIPALVILVISSFFSYSSASSAEATATAQVQLDIRETRREIRKVMRAAGRIAAQAERGGKIFKSSCTSCHSDMSLKTFSPSVESIAKAIQDPSITDHTTIRTKQMPEITDTNIHDIATYLSVSTHPAQRGELVFKTNCILCHGVNGNGMGRASVFFDPPPADLTHSDKNDEYKRLIITLGGEAMGRSSVMPVWGQELSAKQIDDVVAFLRSILVVPVPE